MSFLSTKSVCLNRYVVHIAERYRIKLLIFRNHSVPCKSPSYVLYACGVWYQYTADITTDYYTRLTVSLPGQSG